MTHVSITVSITVDYTPVPLYTEIPCTPVLGILQGYLQALAHITHMTHVSITDVSITVDLYAEIPCTPVLGILQGYLTGVSYRGILQGYLTGVSYRGILHGILIRTSSSRKLSSCPAQSQLGQVLGTAASNGPAETDVKSSRGARTTWMGVSSPTGCSMPSKSVMTTIHNAVDS
jgi:hypothetical protein